MHLFLNHIPVIGGFGALLLLGWGLLRRSIDVTLAALTAFIIVGLVAVPVFLTGQRAERQLDPALETRIEKHEDAAIAAMVGLEAAAGVALASIFCWRTTRRFPAFSATATLLLGLAASVLVVRAASLGGEIRHTEIRRVAPPQARLPM